MNDKYKEERKEPTIPAARGGLKLIFDGENLLMLGGKIKSKYEYPAGSGSGNGSGRCVIGGHWITPVELWMYSAYNDFIQSSQDADNHFDAWGMYRISVHSFPGSNDSERGGFFLHGGADFISAGCITLSHHMDVFVKDMASELELPFKIETSIFHYRYPWEKEDNAKCYMPLDVIYK
jgi:hypothetical protein